MVVVLPFFVVTAALVLVGLSQMHASSHGSAGAVGWLVGKLTAPAVAIFNLAIQATRALTSRFAAAQLALLAAFFSGMAALWKAYFQASGNLARAEADAAEAIWDAVPWEVDRKVNPVKRDAHRAGQKAAAAAAAAAATRHALHRYEAKTNPQLHELHHATSVAIPHDIAGLRARDKALTDKQTKDAGAIAGLEDGAVKTWEWIRSHPLSAVTGVFAGAVVVALSRLGYGFLRCNSWRKLGRSIKCSDANILGDLLALATGILAAEVSLTEFVRFCQSIENEAIGELHAFIKD